jgi:hypothetical protein
VSTTATAFDKESLLDDLTREHRRLDAQVRELEKRISLSPAEQLELSRLKKQKLLTKDKIVRLQT